MTVEPGRIESLELVTDTTQNIYRLISNLSTSAA